MASLVVGAAGAAIGGAIGGTFMGMSAAGIGWAVGSTLGSMLFADDTKIQGPRLDDLSVIDSSYGQSIPLIYGRDRVAGNIIWAKDLEEVKTEEEEGKGGPKTTTTTYQYYATFALGLCEGEILGVRRIWINSKLVYKFTNDATVEELLASNSRIDGITVYTGSESQDPDPLIQADKGVANTPAFRGLAYMVFDRLEVTETGGIPNITVEVLASGSTGVRGFIKQERFTIPSFGDGGRLRTRALYDFNDGTVRASVTAADDLLTASSEIQAYVPERIFTLDTSGNVIRQTDTALGAGGTLTDGVAQATDVSRLIDSKNCERCAAIDGDWVWINGRNQIGVTSNVGSLLGWGFVDDVLGVTRNTSFSRQDLETELIDAGATGEWLIAAVGSVNQASGFLYAFTAPSLSGGNYTVNKYYKFELVGRILQITETGSVSGFSQSTLDEAQGLGLEGSDAALFAENESNIWGSRLASGTSIRALLGEKSGTTIAFSVIHSQSTSTTYQYSSITASNGMGILYCTPQDDLGDMYFVSRAPVLSTSGVTLSSIVSDLCLRAGLSASDIDVTDLTDTVQGYTVSRMMSARKAIEPLMMAYHFDGGEFNNKLNFVKRGGSVVTTIPENDLGADSDDLYSHTRQQEAELPSEVILDYKDLDRDFQPGSQRSRRINTNVENISKVDVPIALTANEAKRITEIHHYNAWVEREKFNIQVTQEYIDLNPTDVIQFTAEGDTRKARIVDMNYGPVMKLECVAESGAYTSDAIAGESESVEQTLGLVGPTNLQLLDIPMLRNNHNDAGIYLAASGYYNGWAGCRVYKSIDDISYSEVDSLFNKATQGYTTNVLADASHTSWDRSSTLTVKWTAGTAPGSITESNAVKGVRYFLVGDEILIPVNETDNGNGTYTYDTFVRGRRGTDWATSEHAIGDRVVILTESTLSRLEVVLSTLRYFKGVSIGNYLANAESESFTNTGVSLKPFSPTFIRGTRDGSNNLTITWIPRSRYIGGALQPLPLFEGSEEYKVQVLDALGGSVIRTLSPNPTSPTDSYSATDQTSDGFTPGSSLIPVRITQLSDTVGDGYPAEALI